MKNPLALAAILLSAVVLLSGCVNYGEQKTPTGKGIVITDFSSSREEVEGKDKTVRIYMDVENQGGYSTDKVLMCLIGSFGETSDGMWKLEEEQCKKSSKTLEAADPINSLPGGTARATWTLKSPWIPYPQERKDTLTGRVYYLYKTRTTGKVIVYSETEIETAKQKGESLSSVGEQVSTIAPVQISLSTARLIRAEDGYFTLKITVSNVGGGVVFNHENFDWSSTTPPKISVENLNLLKLSVDYPENSLELEACENQIELKKGETRTISCDFKIKNPESITTKIAFPITVETEYGYYVDSELSITARGKKGEER